MAGAADDDERAARDAMAAGVDAASAAVAAGVEAVFQAGSAKRKRAEEGLEARERETLTALEVAVKVKEDAETEALEIWSGRSVPR
jgi:hypothetical protein